MNCFAYFSPALFHCSLTSANRKAKSLSNDRLFKDGAQTRNRTRDTRIFNPLLYRLSYLGNAGRIKRILRS